MIARRTFGTLGLAVLLNACFGPSSRSPTPVRGWGGGAGSLTPGGPAAPTAPLADRLSHRIVSVAPAKIGHDQYLAAVPIVAPGAGGSLRVAWSDGPDSRIRQLDAGDQPIGDDMVLPGRLVVAMAMADDGGLYVASIPFVPDMFSYMTAHVLELVRYRPDGSRLWRTRVVGGEGMGKDARWYDYATPPSVTIVGSGERLGVYLGIGRNWGTADKPDVHQGDHWVTFDAADGRQRADELESWAQSHSFQQLVAVGSQGQFFTAAIGDSYPVGVQVINRDADQRAVVWPPAQLGVTSEHMESTHGAGSPAGFVRLGDRLFVALGAWARGHAATYGEAADVLLVSFDEALGDVRTTWLAQDPSLDESYATLQPQHDGVLALWRTSPAGERDAGPTATLARLDAAGRLVEGPVATGEPLEAHSQPVRLTDGTIAWVTAAYRGSELRVARVRP